MRQSFALSEQAHADDLSVDRRVKPRVMVVAGSVAQRFAVAGALRQDGFEVVEAASGAEALELSALMALDAVVLDVNQTDDDWAGICCRLKAASAVFLPVLHLSAASMSRETRSRGLDADPDSYLAHPFDAAELRAAVSALVRLKRHDLAGPAEPAGASLLQESLDALSDHVALLGPSGDIVGLNRAWMAFASGNDYPDDDAGLGLDYASVCDAAEGAGSNGAAEAAAGIRAVLAAECDQFEMDYPCHSPTTQRWFGMKVSRVHGPGPVAAIVMHADKTAEYQRSKSDAHFRRFVDTAHEGVLEMDLVGRITYANPCIGSLLGYTPAELEGRMVFEFMPPAAALEARTRLAARWEGEANRRIEHQAVRRDGGILDVLVSESIIRDDRGEVAGVLAMLTDVSEHHAALRAMGAALQAADADRRRLEATLEAIPVAVWLADADGRVTHTNAAADRVWGGVAPHVASVAEYAEYRATWPATGARVAPEEWAMARARSNRETIHDELMEIERLDGTRGFVLVSAAPILDVEGRLIGAVGINVDVTAQQAADAERELLVAGLQREREHLASVIAEAPSFFAILRGPDHVFERVNHAYRQMIGHRDLIGMPVAEAVPESVGQGFIELLDRVRATGEPFFGSQLPLRLAREPGGVLETRYINFVYQRLDDPSGDHALVAHGVDVTDQVLATEKLRHSETMLRDQFAKLPVPTYLWERQGEDFVLVDVNEAGAERIRIRSDNPIGMLHSELYPERLDTPHDLRESLRTDTVIRRSIEINLGPTEGSRYVELTIGPQQPNRVLVHAIDTTDRVRLEVQLRQAQKMEAIGRLASGVAHDFNNVLTVIGAHASFLLETLEPGDPQREDVETIQKAGVHAAGLTRQLLAFSRQQILQPRLLDLNAVVTDTQQMLARLLGEDIAIASSLAPDLPSVVADAGQVEQVLMNLAVNARDAMPDGGHLAITTRLMSVSSGIPSAPMVPPGEYVVLEVRDTGTGMSQEVQGRLFEPFFTTKAVGTGTGLGLATVYGIVKQSSGYITVASAFGKGSTFRILLPAVRGAEAHEQLRVAERAVARGIETVLVVEDEPAIRAAAKRMLQRLGYVVLEAASGEAALELSASYQAPIDLVVSDAVMPGIGGVETVRRLQEQRPTLKALFISGYTNDEIMRRGIVSSSLRFVQKPFTVADFGRAVREALEDSSEVRNNRENGRERLPASDGAMR